MDGSLSCAGGRLYKYDHLKVRRLRPPLSMCGGVVAICFVESSWSAHGDASSVDKQIMTLFFVNAVVSCCLQDVFKGFKGEFLEASVSGFSQWLSSESIKLA